MAAQSGREVAENRQHDVTTELTSAAVPSVENRFNVEWTHAPGAVFGAGRRALVRRSQGALAGGKGRDSRYLFEAESLSVHNAPLLSAIQSKTTLPDSSERRSTIRSLYSEMHPAPSFVA